MKCERCNSIIKDGELYCDNCGAKVKSKLDNTTRIDIGVLKGKNNKDDDDFYQKGLESNPNPVNIFLVVLVIVLGVAVLYLYFFYDKNLDDERNETTINTIQETYQRIYYNHCNFIIPSSIIYQYSEDKVFLSSDRFIGSIYQVENNYDDVISNIDELMTKWKETGIRISSHHELEKGIYELEGSVNNKYKVFYLCDLEDMIIVMELDFETQTYFLQNHDLLLKMIKSIEKNQTHLDHSFLYPKFNVEDMISE